MRSLCLQSRRLLAGAQALLGGDAANTQTAGMTPCTLINDFVWRCDRLDFRRQNQSSSPQYYLHCKRLSCMAML